MNISGSQTLTHPQRAHFSVDVAVRVCDCVTVSLRVSACVHSSLLLLNGCVRARAALPEWSWSLVRDSCCRPPAMPSATATVRIARSDRRNIRTRCDRCACTGQNDSNDSPYVSLNCPLLSTFRNLLEVGVWVIFFKLLSNLLTSNALRSGLFFFFSSFCGVWWGNADDDDGSISSMFGVCDPKTCSLVRAFGVVVVVVAGVGE